MNHELQESRTPLKRHSYLSRDDRIQVQTLRGLGMTYETISQELEITIRQVQIACTSRATPKKRSGRHSFLSKEQVNDLVEFVISSFEARRMSYEALTIAMNWRVSRDVIQRALKAEGFSRYIAQRKLPLSPANITK
jgi:transposase